MNFSAPFAKHNSFPIQKTEKIQIYIYTHTHIQTNHLILKIQRKIIALIVAYINAAIPCTSHIKLRKNLIKKSHLP